MQWGRVKANLDPTPTSLFTEILPACGSTNFRHRVSLSPVPSTFLAVHPHLAGLLEDLPRILRGNADPVSLTGKRARLNVVVIPLTQSIS